MQDIDNWFPAVTISRCSEASSQPPKRIADLPPDRVEEADRLVRQLALGDDALEQVVQSALLRFLHERERPRGALRPNVRIEAVRAVIEALERDRPVPDGETTDP